MNLHELRPAEVQQVQGSVWAAAPVPVSAKPPVTVTRVRRLAAEARRTALKAVRCLCPVVSRRGFHNNFMKVYSVVNIEALNRFENGTVITAELLKAEGIISKIEKDGLKVLGRGELTQRLTVKAAKVSNSAREAIVAVGGTVEVPNV